MNHAALTLFVYDSIAVRLAKASGCEQVEHTFVNHCTWLATIDLRRQRWSPAYISAIIKDRAQKFFFRLLRKTANLLPNTVQHRTEPCSQNHKPATIVQDSLWWLSTYFSDFRKPLAASCV